MLNRTLSRLQPYLTPLTLGFAGFTVVLVGFFALAEDVREGDTLSVDQTALELINSRSSDLLDNFFIAVTTAGGEMAIAVMTTGVVGLLLARKRVRDAVVIGGTVAGATVSVYILKLLFARPRPDLWQTLVEESTYSFPSGHAIASSAFALSLIAVAWSSRWRWPVVIIGVVYMLTIGYSRLYLGVHYPTDIVASWLLSAAWVIIVYQVVYLVGRRHNPFITRS